MRKFNAQTAALVENEELCRNVFNNFQLGQSISFIAGKYQISRYAVLKLVTYWKEKERPHVGCGQ